MWTSAMLLSTVILGVAPPAGDAGDYQTAVGKIESEVESPTADRQQSIATLEEQLDRVGQFPDEAQGEVAATILRGWVLLAKLYLVEGDEGAARNAMDEAIRTARAQPLGVGEFGPAINQVYKDRKAALEAEGTARIEVICNVACKVVINNRLVREGSETLFLGTYRIWVKAHEAVEPNAEWKFYEVVLSKAGEVETVEYAHSVPPIKIAPPEPEVRRDPPPLIIEPKVEAIPPPKPKRMLPRGVELAGVAAGVGLVVAGAILLSFDKRCEISKQRLTEDMTQAECPGIYETSPGGFSLVGVGGGLLLISSVLVSVDAARVGRERGRQVMVGVSLRF